MRIIDIARQLGALLHKRMYDISRHETSRGLIVKTRMGSAENRERTASLRGCFAGFREGALALPTFPKKISG